jgi:hypothetical protein
MRLSEHFDLNELTLSQEAVRLGIDNMPGAAEIACLRDLCIYGLEPVRDLAGQPIFPSSGFRCLALNRALGSRDDSQHVLGQAADCIAKGYTVQELFDLIRSSNIPYDQLIQEYDRWVHFSYRPKGRRQALYAVKENGQTKYEAA